MEGTVMYVDAAGSRVTPARAIGDTAALRAAASYSVSLKPGEDGRIVARCVELSGAITDGKDEEEALRNIAEAICLYLEPGQPDAFNLEVVGA